MKSVSVGPYALSLCALAMLAYAGATSHRALAANGRTSRDAVAPKSSEPDRCKLLTDAEVDQAIGPHEPGHPGLPNLWGTQSCRWTAKLAQKMDGYPNGYHDAIEVAEFVGNQAAIARQAAEGDPVPGFAKKAQFDKSYGRLWFECASGQYCAVAVDTNAGEHRLEIATRVAHLMEGRVR